MDQIFGKGRLQIYTKRYKPRESHDRGLSPNGLSKIQTF